MIETIKKLATIRTGSHPSTLAACHAQRNELLDMLATLVPANPTLGSPLQAIEYALDMSERWQNDMGIRFLRDWRRGDLSDWPAYREMIGKLRATKR